MSDLGKDSASSLFSFELEVSLIFVTHPRKSPSDLNSFVAAFSDNCSTCTLTTLQILSQWICTLKYLGKIKMDTFPVGFFHIWFLFCQPFQLRSHRYKGAETSYHFSIPLKEKKLHYRGKKPRVCAYVVYIFSILTTLN